MNPWVPLSSLPGLSSGSPSALLSLRAVKAVHLKACESTLQVFFFAYVGHCCSLRVHPGGIEGADFTQE